MRSKTENLRFFEDMAKIAGGAIKSMGDAKGQIKSIVNGFLDDMDIVSRDDFERVEAIAKKALERNAELEKRIKALEKVSNKKTTVKSKTSANKKLESNKKTSAKKSTVKKPAKKKTTSRKKKK